MKEEIKYGTCPVCDGTGRVPATGQWDKFVASYDPDTNTVECRNCGTPYRRSTGKVRLRSDGTPCVHERDVTVLGRCYRQYTCKHCGEYYTVDSSD